MKATVQFSPFRSRPRGGTAAFWALLLCLIFGYAEIRGATVSYNTGYSFTHDGVVNTGTLSIFTTYSNTQVSTSGTLSLPRFNPTLGTLTAVDVTVATTTSTLTIQKTVSFNANLLSTATASRTLDYAISAGTATGGSSANASTSGATLLTLLGNPTSAIGGASLNHTTSFSTAPHLAQFTGIPTFSVTLTASNAFSVRTAVSLFNAGFSGTGTYAGTVTVLYTYTPFTYTVSGSVYRDANYNGFKDTGEAGTGLTLYAKLVDAATPTGPALQVATVDSSTGLYSFSGVVAGSYRLVVSTDNVLANVAPATVPSGWTAIEQASRVRTGVVVGAANVPNQNFGYAPASTLAGQVFGDTGSGGGTANDGVRNGSESGLAGIALGLLDASNAVLSSVASDADGTYRFHLPATLGAGAVLRVVATNSPLGVSTGGSAGTTGGAYQRSTDTVTFTHTANASYTGVNFADVSVPQLTTDGQQTALPGTTILFAHQFIAGTAGTVQFASSHPPASTAAGWTEILYLDANANGLVDPSEQVPSGAIAVTTGQIVNLVLKVFAPASAPYGAQSGATVSALFVFTNASPALSTTLTRTDLTLVNGPTTAGLNLVTTVDKAAAKPGETITYTITFTNKGAAPLNNVVVFDSTPKFTRFVSAAVGTLPSGFGLATLTQPTIGSIGALSWHFSGSLPSSGTGVATFAVVVEN